MKILLITLMLLFSGITPAQDILIIKKDSVAKFDGFLVSPNQMKRFRLINERKKLLEDQKRTLEALRVVKDDMVQIYKVNAQEAYKRLRKERFSSNLKLILGFVGGVLLTGGLAYGLQRSLR